MRELLCLMGIHAPKRRYVEKVEDRFHAPCRHCGRALVKGARFWWARPS